MVVLRGGCFSGFVDHWIWNSAGCGPRILRQCGARTALYSVVTLALVTGMLALAVQLEFLLVLVVLSGLGIFGCVFAVNSAVHSYLILAYTDSDNVSLNVGFYYMSNAGGRLVGTFLSGLIYLGAGLSGCLWATTGFVAVAAVLTACLLREEASDT